MSTTLRPSPQTEIVYPESDGELMAENTVQFQWIVTIEGGLENVFRDDPNVFVAGDLFWYPVEGNPTVRMAPGVLVAFGRPKGHRGSYLQWLEGNIAPQVVFEILSPGNRAGEMNREFQFYERYGVDEYYLYDPDSGELNGWLRSGDRLQQIPNMHGWVSPRLNVRFELVDKELALYGPDGRKFLTYQELAVQRDQEQQEKEEARRQATDHAERAERLAAQLRALGVEPES